MFRSSIYRLVLIVLYLQSSFQSFSQIDHWETVVFENDNWTYLVPWFAMDPTWADNGYVPTGWNTAPGGFGYGDGDDNTVLPNGTVSVFQRIEFNISDTSDIKAAALTIDYDDGFVAYLNGVEITRDQMLSPGQPQWNELAAGLHEAQLYQGIYPAQFTISEAFIEQNMVNGTNVLAVQTHNQSGSSSDLSSRVYLSLGIESTATNYSPTPGWFVPPLIFSESNLPIVVINTDFGAGIPDEPKIDAEMGIIWNGDGQTNYLSDPFNEFYGDIGIELRGSSSQGFPKKPYSIETRGPDSSNYNASIFNWPADNDWALIAPYSDKTLIRNVLTYKLGNEMGNYTPRTKLCELVLNGNYQGVYVFTERIKQNPGRVDVEELEYSDTTGNELSGGYIVKIDKTTGGGIIAWTSPFAQQPPATGPVNYQLHDPKIDTIHPQQLNYIESYITDFETALNGPNFADPLIGYEPFIDVMSFVDFLIVNELSKNVDGYRISTFYHKEHVNDGGLLKAGPLWDFNLAWGNADYCQGGLTTGWEMDFNSICGGGGALNNPNHWNRLVLDPSFAHTLNCRWQELRMDILHEDSLLTFIDQQAMLLNQPAQRNFAQWPTLGTYVWPNNFIGSTYQEEIDYMKGWISARLIWMDANMFGSCPDLGVANKEIQLAIYPNPAQSKVFIQFYRTFEDVRIEIVDLTGRIVMFNEFIQGNNFELDMSNLEKGTYIINIYSQNNQIANERIIKC